ncbi:MAG: ribonuclease HII [Chitinophagales bacterium]|nr:ribonuclease HII [Chitinophagales bacterium]
MLQPYYQKRYVEAGCDEAGRGCYAGPVFAASVILPKNFFHPLLNDSKKVSEKNRNTLRKVIENEAIAFSVIKVGRSIIDKINILNASILAMHLCIDKLSVNPELILVDGNRFKRYKLIPHQCIIGGDSKYTSIAAASILAKTYRDDFMTRLHASYPEYSWIKNKGYGTQDHLNAISKFGRSKHHRLSFSIAAAFNETSKS